jgi:hypothetical protein
MRKMRGDNGEKRCSKDCKTSEGDDPHRPRQPEPEVSTGHPQEENERTDDSDYGDDDDDVAIFRQMKV